MMLKKIVLRKSTFLYILNKRFKNEISAILNKNETDNFNLNVLNFDRCLESTIEKFAYKRKMNECKYKLWFNNELRLLKREQLFKYQSAINENTSEAWNNYNARKNIYEVKIEREKNRYITNKINNAYNQREM